MKNTVATDGFKGRLKKRSRRLFHLPCDKGYLKIPAVDVSGILFSDGLQRLNPLQPAPSPVGEGWGEGTPRMAAIFPNTPTVQIQTLRFVALSLTLSHGREDGAAVGVKGSARKQVVLAAFYFSGSLYRKADGTNAASVFSDDL